MARVQLVVPDADKDRFVHQARREGMSLSAWLRAAAYERLEKYRNYRKFQSVEELREFWERCDARCESLPEPDWEEHLAVINESKLSGLPRL